MELLTKLSWLDLAGLHVSPALDLFHPPLAEKLYGVDPSSDLGLLIVHRGALFFAVLLLCLYAMIDPSARRAASLLVGVSMLSFIWLYYRAGGGEGPLRLIAIADLIGLVPLSLVVYAVWFSQR